MTKSNKFILLSHVLSTKTPSYGDRDKFEVIKKSEISGGDTSNTAMWNFSNNHIGTHIDVPYHFDDAGKQLLDIPNNDWFFNQVCMINIPRDDCTLISQEDIMGKDIAGSVELLLIRTGYEKYRSNDRYWNDNPGIAPEIAGYLRGKYPKLRCIGFDFISLTSWKSRGVGKLAHKEFLSPGQNNAPILVVEDMSLVNVRSKLKKVIVAPLMVDGADGGPVTVFGEY